MKLHLLVCACCSVLATQLAAQCPAGEANVSITIHTDDYGKEAYWQLVPHNFNCGTGTVASGGNTSIGCNGGGDQTQTPGGYANNTSVTEGPWCLAETAVYDLISVDDWGDGGTGFTVNIDGFPVYEFRSVDATERFDFVVKKPLAYDMKALKITTPKYIFNGAQQIQGVLKNISTSIITSLTLNYSIDNGTAVSTNLTSLNIDPFTEFEFIHPTSWNTPGSGEYVLKVWASNLNGNADMDSTNDIVTDTIVVFAPAPDLIDEYLTDSLVYTTIASSTNEISVPRDLDFHPDLRRFELWVVLKQTEGTGGKTVTIHNAGQPNQSSQLLQDGNAWHFMSLPTAIAFSDNENFATSPGVFDANHDGGSHFTGPALWSSDFSIYAQPSGLNGSHLDMLHESPYCMGICHEKDNAFWVMDGGAGNVVRYDFGLPHVPGGDDHSDGIIWRYPAVTFQPDTTYHVPSHCILDKANHMLYGIDFGGRKVFKLDITSGTPGSALTPHEATQEYRNYNNPIHSTIIDTGLVQPSGIEYFNNRLLVGDYANGDIRFYDLANNAAYLGKISTGAPGLMGIKVGPDGKIWYVNSAQNNVVRIDGPVQVISGVSDQEADVLNMQVYPNPNSGTFHIQLPYSAETVSIFDIAGREVWTTKSAARSIQVAEQFSNGIYFVKATAKGKSTVQRIVIQ